MTEQTEFLVQYPVRAILDLPTSHLRTSTHKWLDQMMELPESDRCLGSCAKTSHGWLLHVPQVYDASCTSLVEALPEDLAEVLRYANSRKCEYVLFDRDASPHESVPLPVYDEETDEGQPLRNWQVILSCNITDSLEATVIVKAINATEAEKAAIDERVWKSADWKVTSQGRYEDVEVACEPVWLDAPKAKEETGE